MNWNEKDIRNLKLGSNVDAKRKENTVLGNKNYTIHKKSIEKDTIKTVLFVLKHEKLIPDYTEEFKFDQIRKFRFDWAIPSLKIAIEYEGLMSKKSGHTTISGYTKDCDKYNLACVTGWKVLRYTAKNYKDFESDLKNLLKK